MSKQTRMPHGFTDKEPKMKKGFVPERMCLIEYSPGKFIKAFRKPVKLNDQHSVAGSPNPMRTILKYEAA